MQFLAWLKANRFARCDRHFRPGPRISSNPGLAGADIENPEAPEFNPVTRGQSLFQAFKDRVNRRFGLVPRQSGLGDDLVNNVLFNQCLHPDG